MPVLTSAEENVMLKSFLLIFAVALIVLASTARQGRSAQEATPTPAVAPTPAAAPAQPTPTPVKNPVKPTAESQAKAKSLYQIDCALCHGDNGSGKTDLATSMDLTLSDWTDPKTLAGKEDWELFNIIRNGKGANMPAEGEGRAKDDEVWNLVIYIRSFSKPQPLAPATPAK
jgi:mono/diheme cytochrome c family protein